MFLNFDARFLLFLYLLFDLNGIILLTNWIILKWPVLTIGGCVLLFWGWRSGACRFWVLKDVIIITINWFKVGVGVGVIGAFFLWYNNVIKTIYFLRVISFVGKLLLILRGIVGCLSHHHTILHMLNYWWMS